MKTAYLNARLDPELHEQLRAWARRDETTMASVVRRLIRQEIERERERWKRADHNDFA